MPALPSGTVTFLFSDIEHSTHLLQHLGDRYADVLAKYRRLGMKLLETVMLEETPCNTHLAAS